MTMWNTNQSRWNSRCRGGSGSGRIIHAMILGVCLSLNWGCGLVSDAMGGAPTSDLNRKPNVVIIFIDDLGYGDIGSFGAQGYATPHLDRLAREGMKFTDFQVSSAVCSASRIGLLTGCYHQRLGISGALGPNAEIGISDQEVTLGELAKSQGYATAIFGKWHLGHHPQFLPTRHGFDEYLGLPYSNDMWPYHPDFARLPAAAAQRKQNYPPLPLIEQDRVIQPEVLAADQAQLTTRYTERAVDFIHRHAEQPFLLYLPHTMVHVPLFVSEKFRGKSERGLFGDVAMEVDWSVGEILRAITDIDADNRTLVIFTSDNGPWLSYGEHAGNAGPLREGKGSMFEGGCRVPALMRWPDVIPGGSTCDELASTIDLLPTIAAIIGASLPSHPIDGKDLGPLMRGDANALSPHPYFYHFYSQELHAIRDRRWKLHFPHSYPSLNGQPGGTAGSPAPYVTLKTGLELYDLKSDIGETTNLAEQHPEIVARLQVAANVARSELGDKLSNAVGRGVRAAGKLAK